MLGACTPKQSRRFFSQEAAAFCCIGFPFGGSSQWPRPLTDEGGPCDTKPFAGNSGKLAPHPASDGASATFPPRGKALCISLFTNITRKTRPVCYKANTKKWDVPYFRHIPQILRQLFGLLPKQLHVVVVGKGNGVVARGLQRAELLAQLLRLGQHGHVVVGA